LAIKSLPQDRQTGKSQHQPSFPYNYWTNWWSIASTVQVEQEILDI
jgi:hypothetical protein